MAIRFILALMVLVSAVCSQTNTWTMVTGNQVGDRSFPALVYAPLINGFVYTMGDQTDNGQETNPAGPYSVLLYNQGLGHWINYLPNDTLYGSAATANTADSAAGKWADSTGNAYGNGRGMPYGSPYFTKMNGYLRPKLWWYYNKITRAYRQFAYDSDDGKIYFYLNNMTFTFNPQTRLWDTLMTARHPNDTAGAWGQLVWGSMCYDPVNQEVVLFGGGGVDRPNGNTGTWTFKPSTKTWTKLGLAVQPAPRAHSPMVYDAKNQVIVLFGGDHLDSLMSDTWIYQCSNRIWIKKSPAKCPSPRASHALLYLPKSQSVVLLGGYNYSTLTFEIWRYDAAADVWGLVKHAGAGDVVPKFDHGSAVMCAAADTGDRVVAMGDSGIVNHSHFDPATYLMTCDPSQIDGPGTQTYGVTPGANQIAAPSPSWYEQGVTAPDTAAQEALLRAIPQKTWVKITPPKMEGSQRAWSSTIIDLERDKILRWAGGHVTWCGTDVPQYNIADNRWHAGYAPENEMDFNGWGDPRPGPFTFNNRPFMSPHTYHMYDMDYNLHRMLFCSGTYTFIYNPDIMDWEYPPVKNPSNVLGHDQTTICPTSHGAVLIQGDISSGGNQSGLFLFSAASKQWNVINYTGTGMPSIYGEQTGAAYDSKRDRLLISYAGTMHAMTFSNNTLTNLSPSGSASGGYYRESIYLPTQDKVYFGMNISGGANLIYDCATNAWGTMTIAKGSSGLADANIGEVSAGFMYDMKRNLVWLCTIASDLYVFRPDANLSGIESGQNENSKELSLAAHPNPSNPGTVLRVCLPHATVVSLNLYSVDGTLVRTLSENTRMTAGLHRIEWNGVDNKGRTIATGVYLAVLKTDKLEKQIKLTLLK